jgi:hypothetical protein
MKDPRLRAIDPNDGVKMMGHGDLLGTLSYRAHLS